MADLGSSDGSGPGWDDRAAREEFVRATYVGLFRWFGRLSGSPDRAADLAQDTFAAYWASAGRARAGVSPRTWLYAIGRNLWRKHLRDRKPRAPALSLVDRPDAGGRAPDQDLHDREFREAADRAVGALPADLREAFTLRFWQGFEYEEIGQVQGVAAALARWRYFAARRRLHRALGAWDPDRERAEENQHAR